MAFPLLLLNLLHFDYNRQPAGCPLARQMWPDAGACTTSLPLSLTLSLSPPTARLKCSDYLCVVCNRCDVSPCSTLIITVVLLTLVVVVVVCLFAILAQFINETMDLRMFSRLLRLTGIRCM